ncbi:MAG: capsule biosynthesis protein [Pararhodobacter sp.]|nr:capsule biosynthesis protein [Pararhodobacter sp.]
MRLLRPVERRQAPAANDRARNAPVGNSSPRNRPEAAHPQGQRPAAAAVPEARTPRKPTPAAPRQGATGAGTAPKAARPAAGSGATKGTAAQDKGAAQRNAAQGQGAQGQRVAGRGEHGADVTGSARAEAENEALRNEGLTAHQLRLAMRIAQRQGIKASSGIEAVRLLRERGIDPFETSKLLESDTLPAPIGAGQGIAGQDEANDAESGENATTGRALTTTEQPALPRTRRQPPPPAQTEARNTQPAVSQRRNQEIARIQTDIVRRRRRRLALLASRLLVFVILPTLLTAWYFYRIATPLYATNTEFVIQQADSASPSAPGMGGLFAGTGLATSQDSVTVQSYLQSREAMRRLDAEEGFKDHFRDSRIDPIRRLSLDASDEAAYRLYRRHVQISYDPTEGVVRMEVIAADPETSERFSRALIGFAEEQVDRLTQRLRDNQMRDAEESFQRAEERNNEAQMRVLELQERYQVLSSEVEVSLLTQQITTLEGQLNQERLALEDLRANPRPNQARVAQVERRIAALESQIGSLRAMLTEGSAGGMSLARVQRELAMAEADVQTRQLLLTQALQQLEAARVEASRQVRYLSMGVSPVAPDESTYPRRFENTALAFLIFGGIYLMFSMTVSILREQVTS